MIMSHANRRLWAVSSRYAGASLLVLCLVVGCHNRSQNAADTARVSQYQNSGADAPLRQMSLKKAYPEVHFADVCADDSGCDPPLRCMSGSCRFPPAMTGARNEASGQIVIHTEDGTRSYYLELASTPYQRHLGLMYRRHMQPGFGMLFVFPTEEHQAFWMKNTLIPLDMVFIRSDLTIDSIVKNAKPRTLTARKSAGAVQYVLELRGGETTRAGIQPGDHVDLPDLDEHGLP